MGVNKKNAEGYPDPTAYEALMNIIKKERNIKASRPIVCICSPLSADSKQNFEVTRKYCRFAVAKGRMPIAPYLLLLQFLDDNDQFERKLSCRFGEMLMNMCSEVWVFGSCSVRCAEHQGRTVRYFTEHMEEVVNDGSSRHTWSLHSV